MFKPNFKVLIIFTVALSFFIYFKEDNTNRRSVSVTNTNNNKKNPLRNYLTVETANESVPIGLPVITSAPGGIGNQLFGFACAYATAKKRNSNVYVLTRHFEVENDTDHGHLPEGRDFSLDHFSIDFSGVVAEDFSSYGSGGQIFKFKDSHIWENTLPLDRVLQVGDVCMSEVYFKEYREELKKMFTLKIDESPIKNILQQIEESESVAVHIRRGDYRETEDNRTLPITFQKRAIKWMKRIVSSNATFFVFTDDIDFVLREFQDYQNIVYVDNSEEDLSSLYDFLLMTRCKHNIIANSTFSWWTAYLNKNKDKIVIAPFPRHPPGWNEGMYKDEKLLKYRELILNYYLYPVDWLTLNPFEY